MLQVPRRLSIFCWLASLNAIPVRTLLVDRGLNIDAYCPRCHDHFESVSHAFWLCPDI